MNYSQTQTTQNMFGKMFGKAENHAYHNKKRLHSLHLSLFQNPSSPFQGLSQI